MRLIHPGRLAAGYSARAMAEVAMGLVQITGAEEVVRAVMNVPDLNIVQSSVEPRGEGKWKVAAYASDDAIDAATALVRQPDFVILGVAA
jgi:hypothetical protein